MAIEIIREPAALEPLASAWNELAKPFDTPLLQYEWFAACAEAFCPPGDLSVLVVSSHGDVTAIAPLASMRSGKIETLQLLGSHFLYEPGGLLYRGEESLTVLLKAILAIRKPVLFTRLPSDSLDVRTLQTICPGHALFACRNTVGSPWLPIATTWPEFEAAISPRRRASLRRSRKRVEALGKPEFEVFSPDPGGLAPYLDEIFRVEASGWKGRNGSAVLSNESVTRFFSMYSHAAARLGILRLCFLRVQGQPIAVQIAVEYANRFWLLKVGYDEAWTRCSPGILLLHDTIRYVFERELQAFEFLGTDEPWLHIWTDYVHPYVTSRIYPFSVEAVLGCGVDMSRLLARQWLPALR